MNWLEVEVDESLFSLEVALKATYWLSGRFLVDVQRRGEGKLVVRIAHSERELTAEERREAEARFRRDLVDFRTREVIDAETRTIRELLVAKAFAYGDEQGA